MSIKPHGVYKGVEYIMGCGPYRMGCGAIVTEWHDTIESAYSEFARLMREDREALQSLADLEQSRAQ